jgi:hypothetical protein
MHCGSCSKNEIVESLQKLSTTFKRNKFFTKHFNYVSPEEIYFGSEEKQIRNHNGVILPRQIKTTFQNISVRQTLTSLFSNEDFFHKFFSEKKSSDGFLRLHRRDGEHFANHPFLKRFPFAVRFQVFYDDVDMINPLGSKTKVHKIGNFCYMILNIPPLENSSQKNIFPFAIVKIKHLKENGFDFVLKEFMKELRILESEEGMPLDIPHRPAFRVHGTLVTADT